MQASFLYNPSGCQLAAGNFNYTYKPVKRGKFLSKNLEAMVVFFTAEGLILYQLTFHARYGL